MATHALNEAVVKSLPAPESGSKVYYFAGAVLQGVPAPRGFAVRVTAASVRSFVINYRIKSKEYRFTIGRHPDWSVLRAVREARDLRQRIDRGENPLDDRAPAPVTKTVTDVLDDWLARYVRGKLRSAGATESVINRLVRPAIGKVGLYELRRSHVMAMLDKIADERGPAMATRTLAIVRSAFNWQVTRDDDFHPPIARGMTRTTKGRDRILSDDEIRTLWTALDAMNSPACYPAFVRTLLLTGQRRSEVSGMRWDEIEGDTWTIPAARYKTNINHAVPLTETVRAIIDQQPKDGPFIFGGQKPFSSYSNARLLLSRKLGASPQWTLHDLRRTAATLMVRAGARPDIADRVIGHVIRGVAGIYNRHDYEVENRDALEKLAAMIERILNPLPSNVETLGEHRARAQS